MSNYEIRTEEVVIKKVFVKTEVELRLVKVGGCGDCYADGKGTMCHDLPDCEGGYFEEVRK